VSHRDLKPVFWVASSKEDLKSFPEPVARSVGFALYRAQEGKKAPAAKPLKGIVKGAGVLEIVEDHDGDTYRVVYTVRLSDAVSLLSGHKLKSDNWL